MNIPVHGLEYAEEYYLLLFILPDTVESRRGSSHYSRKDHADTPLNNSTCS